MRPSTRRGRRAPEAVATPTPPASTVVEGAEGSAASAPVVPPASSSIAVTFGHVKAMSRRLRMEDVKAFLGEAWNRVEALQGVGSTLRLIDRLRASDGSLPPIVFTEDGSDKPTIFAGYETVAAHFGYGTSELDVLFISAQDAPAAQSVMASMMERPKEPDPDAIMASRFAAR